MRVDIRARCLVRDDVGDGFGDTGIANPRHAGHVFVRALIEGDRVVCDRQNVGSLSYDASRGKAKGCQRDEGMSDPRQEMMGLHLYGAPKWRSRSLRGLRLKKGWGDALRREYHTILSYKRPISLMTSRPLLLMP
jgi:hypothetical protein